jgi:hypothetical protein
MDSLRIWINSTRCSNQVRAVFLSELLEQNRSRGTVSDVLDFDAFIDHMRACVCSFVFAEYI